MGLSHSWVAVKGLDRTAALQELALEPVGELSPDELPRLGVGELPGGWLLFLSDDVEAFERGRLAPLTRLGTAVACAEEEHVMYSEARGYAAGAETWRVVHDSEQGARHLQTSGELPPAYERLRREVEAEQDAEDAGEASVDFIYDVPPKLAQSICGFRLGDDDPPGLVFTELQPIGGWPRRPGLLARLFGRR